MAQSGHVTGTNGLAFNLGELSAHVTECIRVHCFAIFGPGHKLHRPFATFYLRLFDVRLAHRLSAQLHLPVEARRELGKIGEGPSPMPRVLGRGSKRWRFKKGPVKNNVRALTPHFQLGPQIRWV